MHGRRRLLLNGSPRHRDRCRGERAFSAALTGLLLLPLLVFAGVAVDVGSWLVEASRVRTAADAAALGGVVSLPAGEAAAVSRARDIAADNGYTHGVDGVTVDVQALGTDVLRVTVTVDAATQYLSNLVRGPTAISRTATAEYVQPVPLGSPRNHLGTGRILSPGDGRENYWLALSGPCASKENGDRISTVSDANFTNASNPRSGGTSYAGCTPGSPAHVVANDEYDPAGYFYALAVPEGAPAAQFQIYDAPYCTTSGSSASDVVPGDSTSGTYWQRYTTLLTIRDSDALLPRDGTPIGPTVSLPGADFGTGVCAGPAAATGTQTCTASQWARCWRTLATVPAGGQYYLQIRSDTPRTDVNPHGTNSFALRAVQGATFDPCSADPSAGDPDQATCPQIFGLDHLGVYANLDGSAGSPAEFFLADIDERHNGKHMQVTLWDTGEGAQRIELLDPDGTAATFDAELLCGDASSAPCTAEAAPAGGYGPFAGVTSVDVSGGGHPQPGGHRASTSRYSDRLLRLSVDLPDDIAAAYGGRTWWKIRYTVGSSSTDRTTWTVIVKGDPVRLVPNT